MDARDKPGHGDVTNGSHRGKPSRDPQQLDAQRAQGEKEEWLRLHRRLRPILVAQMPLHQLAGRRARQLGFEVDALRAFDRRQMLPAEHHQLVRQLLAGPGHVVRLHHRLHLLAHLLVRHAEHGDVGHRGMPDQHVLGLLRVDVHAAGDDHEGGAVGEVEEVVV
ncbi:hypothetical protein KXV85_003715, partial [Aspergillus fumigatus]